MNGSEKYPSSIEKFYSSTRNGRRVSCVVLGGGARQETHAYCIERKAMERAGLTG